MRELEVLKRERAEAETKREQKKARAQAERKEAVLAGNPLLLKDYSTRRKWTEETVFRN